jgi:hypothetical protein
MDRKNGMMRYSGRADKKGQVAKFSAAPEAVSGGLWITVETTSAASNRVCRAR